MENFVDVTGSAATAALSVSVYNCLFTSREIPFDPAKNIWQTVEMVRQSQLSANTPFATTPQGYASPYINNQDYPATTLKDGSNEKPQAGIIIKYSGTANNGVYKKLKIGSGSTITYNLVRSNTNIFDNLAVGIDIKNSNVIVNNCTFQNGTEGSTGIKVQNENIRITPVFVGLGDPPPPPQPPPAIMYAKTGFIDISTPVGSYKNAFFDLTTAICISRNSHMEKFIDYVFNTDNINISHCDIRSNQDVYAPSSDIGTNGIVITTSDYEPLNITSNNIYNIKNGIWYGGGADFARVNFGNMNVNSNTLATEIPGLQNYSAYMQNAINLSAIIYGESASINCKNNEILSTVNGIKLSGWNGSQTMDNRVTLMYDRSSTITEQYGISVEASFGNETGLNIVSHNKVKGYRDVDPNANTTGILLTYSSMTDIGCNEVDNNMHGFRFVGNNPNTRFWDNLMKVTNQYGFTLWEDGTIGQQGILPTLQDTRTCASNNNWEAPASDWNNLGQYMTYCYNSLATKSKFVIRSSSYGEINPEGSAAFNINLPGYKYSIADGSLLYATGVENNCNRCNGLENEYNRSRTLLEEIAEGTVLLPSDEADERLMVMQDQLYNLLRRNPDIIDTSNSLQQFIINSQWTNLDYFYYAGKYLSEENYDAVEMMLDTWPGQSNIDESYHRYFEWLITMYREPEWSPDMDQVSELANQCPAKYGTIVYAVRNLYNALSGKIHDYSNACEGLQGRGNAPVRFIRLKQPLAKKPEIVATNKLLVYPNPASNQVNIVYKKISRVVLMDLTGRLISDQRFGNTDKAQLNVNSLQKGVYLVKVFGEGNAVTERLLIQ